MAIKENFLKKIRERRKISPTELAKRVNISKQTITGIEKQRQGIGDEFLKRLAKELGVSPNEIVPGREKVIQDKADKKLTEEDREKYQFKAFTMLHEYYGDQNFSDDLMVDISRQLLYEFLIPYEKQEDNDNVADLKKSLYKIFCRGLAAKCFLDYLEKNDKHDQKQSI